MKSVLTVLLVLSSLSSIAQGLQKGAAYKHDFQKDIDNEIKQEQLDKQAASERIKSIKRQLDQLKQLHASKGSYKTYGDGWWWVIMTNNYDLMDWRKAYVENGTVKYYVLGNGTQVTVNSGGKVVDAKTTIQYVAYNTNMILDLYFGYK